MAIELREGMGKEMEDVRSVEACDLLSQTLDGVADESVVGVQQLQKPVDNLSPEEISQCWQDTRGLPTSRKPRDWQLNALSLIQQRSEEKRKELARGSRSTKATSTKSGKARSAESGVVTQVKSGVSVQNKPAAKTKQKKVVRRVVRVAKPLPVAQEDVRHQPVPGNERKNLRTNVGVPRQEVVATPAVAVPEVQVRLIHGSQIAKMRCSVVYDGPEWVVLIAPSDYDQVYLELANVSPREICVMRVKMNGMVFSRKVLREPCRYVFQDHVHLIFVSVPAGV